MVIVRRTLLLGPAVVALITWRVAAANPWNLDVFDRGILIGGVVPAALGFCLIGIEVAATFRGFVVRVAALGLAFVAGLVMALGAVVTALTQDDRPAGKVVAVSPDGRIRAVRVDDAASYSIEPTYDLDIRLSAGLDRSTSILSECESDRATITGVRFLDNRTLEYTLSQGTPVRVSFDRNLKAERQQCP
ncbi:hypothetical protein OG948_19670 [Embleya sp. NBC_00888]|uniref:hypothetical protein n=1 Tax=Embleya sp. NBC_00888 TaxID=2975960 RepID=UPI0038681D65|nr:hypothetical protein OG948_19670 [Embleya sp. NBC_00888]